MIVFDVTCGNDHTFEGWFKDSESFDLQVSKGLVECPICGDTNVHKSLVAPRLGGLNKGKDHGEAKAAAAPDGKLRKYLKAAREIRDYVEENSDYVGNRFPEEARKIHYGETESRSIYGEASAQEASNLRDEGIEFHPIPWPEKLDA